MKVLIVTSLLLLVIAGICTCAQKSNFDDLVKLYKRGSITVFIPKSIETEHRIHKTAWYAFDKSLTKGKCSFVNIQCPNKIQYTDVKFVKVEKGILQYEPAPSSAAAESDLHNISEIKNIEEYTFVVEFCSKMGEN